MRDCPNGTRTREFGPFPCVFQKSGLFLEYVAANSYLPRRNLNTAPGWAPRPHALTYAGSFAAAPPVPMRSPGAGPDAADRWAAKLTPTAAPVPEGTPADVPTAGACSDAMKPTTPPIKRVRCRNLRPRMGARIMRTRARIRAPRRQDPQQPGRPQGAAAPLFLRNAADTPPAVSNSRNNRNNRNTILEHLQRIAGGLNRRPVFHFAKLRISETPPGHFAKARISEINPARRCRHYPPKSALYTSRGPISCKKFAFFGVFNRPPGVIHKYLFVICCII